MSARCGGKMNKEEVFNKVKEIIISQLGVSEAAVTPEATFLEDLGADSLDIVSFMLELEETFGLEIPDEEVEKVEKVSDIVNYIMTNLEE